MKIFKHESIKNRTRRRIRLKQAQRALAKAMAAIMKFDLLR